MPDRFIGAENIPLGRIAMEAHYKDSKDCKLWFARTSVNTVVVIYNSDVIGYGIDKCHTDIFSDHEFELLPLDTKITLCFNGKWESGI